MGRFGNKRKRGSGQRGKGGSGGGRGRKPFKRKSPSDRTERASGPAAKRQRTSGGDSRAEQLAAPRPPAVWQAESDSEPEEPSALDQVLQLVGGYRSREVAVDSDEEQDVSDEAAGEEQDEEPVEEVDCSGGSDDGRDDDSEADNDGEGNVDPEEELDDKLDEDEEQEEEESAKNPFSQHFEQILPDPVGECLMNTGATRWQSDRLQWPQLGSLNFQYRDVDTSQVPLTQMGDVDEVQLHSRPGLRPTAQVTDFDIKQQIVSHVAALNEKLFARPLTDLQREILSVISGYRDFYFPHRTIDNEDQLRVVYCAHALNHVLRTRLRIVHHNSKVSRKEDVPDSYRDQGLTRPKVLIVVPFKHSAYRIVNTLISLLQPTGKSSVLKYKRFQQEFGDEGAPPPAPGKVQRPADFLATFAGNTDDAFRLGIQVTKKSMRLYSDFYHSDLLLASPLGLRTVIGAEGETERDTDFLNSIEMLVLDQTDVFLMQNWEHVLHLLEHLHLQPRDSHGVDFSRVRYWTLNGWQRLYRQTLVLAAMPTPEINALVSKQCQNYAGRVVVQNPETVGTIQQVIVQVPQVFHRFDAPSLVAESDARFQFFVDKILPRFRDAQMGHTLLVVPSYFDYVRIRNHFIKETVNFVQVCEYTKDSRVSRARDMFFHGKRHFLLYTERFHFFRRYRIKGVRHLLFYGLPVYPHLYSELCNLMQPVYQSRRSSLASDQADMSCTVLYCRHDRLKLARVVGADRATSMIHSEKHLHMLVTGDS